MIDTTVAAVTLFVAVLAAAVAGLLYGKRHPTRQASLATGGKRRPTDYTLSDQTWQGKYERALAKLDDAAHTLERFRTTCKRILAINSVLVQDDVDDTRLLEVAEQFLAVPPLAESMLGQLKATGAQVVYRDLVDEGVAVRFVIQRKADEGWPSSPQDAPRVQEMIDTYTAVPRATRMPAIYSRQHRAVLADHVDSSFPAVEPLELDDMLLGDDDRRPQEVADGWTAFTEETPDPDDPKNQPHRPELNPQAGLDVRNTCELCGRPVLSPIHRAG
jgi:hypothetical protein